jgi:hypothetical protein
MTAERAVKQGEEVVRVRVTRQMMPAMDARHGTPHPVEERVFTLELPQGTAVIDQTDYGHAGRFNPCHVKSVAPALQPRTPQLLAVAEAIAALL